MRSGELSKRITLQYKTRVPDEHGGFNETFVDACTVWAKAWTVSSGEIVAGNQMNMIRIQKFKIRYRTILKSHWRVKFRDKYFAITGIDPDEKNKEIFLTCKEAV